MQEARAVEAPRTAGVLAARWAWALAAITVVGAVIRYPSLAGGSYWYDEWIVHNIVYVPFHRLPQEVASQQTTPPVYYYVAWAWAQLFGPGADSLRSLSGLFGVATIPAAYATGAVLATRRVGLVVAALVAVNPFLVWYSVEARPYSAVVFFSAVTLLLFALALRHPGWPVLGAWAVSCGLALATHYYAIFLVAAETVVLLVALRRHRAMFAALGVVVLAGIAVTPLALQQRNGTRWIANIPLRQRVDEIVEGFFVGISPFTLWLVWPLAALFVVGLVLAARGTRIERRSALVAGGVGALAFVLAAVPVVAGTDTLLARNVIPLYLPFLLAAGIGLGSERTRVLGLAAAVGICALSLALVVAIPLDRGLQRADWGAAVDALPRHRNTSLLVTWSGYRAAPIFSYLPFLGDPQPWELQLKVDEIDVLALHEPGTGFACWSGAVCGEEQVDFPLRPNLLGLRLASHRRAAGFDVVVYRSRRPVKVGIYPLYWELTTWTTHQPRILVHHKYAGT